MDVGTRVYQGYAGMDPIRTNWINEGVVTDISLDGVPMVNTGGRMEPISDRWRPSRAAAMQDILAAAVKHLGYLQGEVDKLRAGIAAAEASQERQNAVL